ncbi:NAD(P)H-binding protein [Fodinicola feengrottensis]|uniref:NAD(P)H-binding protein n=1 Tax=Fodinicola feengrottensis TaxID=435914 RepID=A0ABN2IS65_9ACTN|nr:NAD(P)H-binding protein [Fodinicola feengrottensis]
MREILVTGATGNVGRQVVKQLLAKGVGVRALTRRPDASLPAGVEAAYGDLEKPESLAAADVSAVFLVWPLHTAETLPAVLEAIGRPVVFLGSGGVRDCTFDQQIELLRRSGLEWTFIRPSTFAANALWWAPQIRAGDIVRGAYGQVAMPMLHEADIAAVAVRALLDGRHAGAVYDLTGPELVAQADQVRLIGEAIGRPLRWEEVDRPRARAQMVADDFPESFVDVLFDAYEQMVPVPITNTVQEVAGRPARTFLTWARDHAADFTAR